MTDAATTSRGVVPAALATAAGATPALLGFNYDPVPTGAVYGFGWPVFGIVAALLLDRDRRSRLGWACAALAAIPAAVVVGAVLTLDDPGRWDRVERGWTWLGVGLIVAAFAVVAWGVDIAADRMSRRRLIWLIGWAAALVAAVLLAQNGGGSRAAATVAALGVAGMAGLVFRLATVRELRPVDEPVIDAAVVVVTLLAGAVVGTAVRAVGQRAGVPGPDVSGAFAAVVAAALVLPAALWLRGRFLARRYGRGTLTPADVEQITADLHAEADVRALLGKAAAMIAAASGHRQVDLVLGPDSPEPPPHWRLYPLIVAGDRVGTVFLEPRHPEGPEPWQERVVRQLLPTVALVAKAVSLAVEADHARRDVARQRDAERARILGDLHDGLGPMLVGMSMRVRAEVRRHPTPLLEALAAELADCRGDLRRLVSGLTPSVLDDADLSTALTRLVGTFNGQGPAVTLDNRLAEPLAPPITVAVYRTVAEGLTNALRHAHAAEVTVAVHTTAGGRVRVEVHDDGTGGPIIPGVGLSSLRRRAEQLGGRFTITSSGGIGTALSLDLPTGGAPA
ncbi:sensor histidine kinase [Dactylosporangium sp. NPDC051541]|uniref:sensor histidine kinase n=1 Tax=Dactylosporangium sp. NPDC051541 TaxID=3363977 RepID=UPI0037B057C1